MATTTNYGWTTPDDTALVKDGAAAIRTLGSSIDTTTKALNAGTTNGDLDYFTSGTAKTRLAIGSTGQVLTVAGGVPSWANASGFSSQGNRVATSQSTTSTSFVNLATTQSVTLTTGTKAVVWGSFGTYNTSSGALNRIGIAVSGATTIAASLTYGVMVKPPTASQDHYYAFGFFFDALTAGSNTFTMQFTTDTGTAFFMNRHLIAANMGS